ncbi:BrnT family toxin [Desulfurispirillum indicum]|uniref:BrnT family toxin n=1 Tax=Desulfurispirillum indicum TaxID=936456 RepID=UPI001CFAD7C8|nr:BrnT family toxin [Desulfurispirillum indicum]UCZ57162.1 BrnT family toxin [Desulfurispirillum indicum]
MKFEWDTRKALSNVKKHGIAFHEAATVFADPLSYVAADPDHSDDEERFLILGISCEHRLLVVAHAERNDVIRIISAREATKKERVFYEEYS